MRDTVLLTDKNQSITRMTIDQRIFLHEKRQLPLLMDRKHSKTLTVWAFSCDMKSLCPAADPTLTTSSMVTAQTGNPFLHLKEILLGYISIVA